MILDTNLLLFHIKNARPIPSETIIPVVVAAELKSLVMQWGWGDNKRSFVDKIIGTYPVIDVSPSLIEIYTTIDTYSLGKHPTKAKLKGETSRVMGKNDLWIASIAMALEETLETTDKDFDHLRSFGLKLVRRDAKDPYGLPTL